MIALKESASAMGALSDLEMKCRQVATQRAALAGAVESLQEELTAVKRRHLANIKNLSARAGEAESELRRFIEDNPRLFDKPKTLTVCGIKVGYRKNAGKIVFDDAATVIALIKRHFRATADTLIRTKEEVNKDALGTLDETELPRIGCRIEGRGDDVVLDAVDDEIEKLVSKFVSTVVATMLEEAA
jgi:phage host-nuclease inhibitor protein Gam